MSASRPSAWLQRLTRDSVAGSMRLFCFPYAGGSASVFRDWNAYLPKNIDAFAIQPPGRETRFAEPPVSDFREYVKQSVQAILPFTDRPFAIFGHSLGAAAAFETARLLEKHGVATRLLIVSGRQSPGSPPRNAPIAHLPDADFLKAVASYNGTPAEVLDNQDLMEILLPMMRADFSLAENYRYTPDLKLSCPIIALASRQDQWLDAETIARWSGMTAGPFESKWFEGDHFYLNQYTRELVELVGERLRLPPGVDA